MKVRVWHKELKKFLPKEEWFLDFDGQLYFLRASYQGMIGDYSSPLWPVTPKDAYVIQSSTGLKDKNGVEIYEGDIINSDKFEIENGKVFFDIGCFKVNTGWQSPWAYKYELFLIPEFERVGNIFENPELLK